mgnify:FL=1
MRPFCDEITHAVYKMKPRNNPLAIKFTIYYCPHVIGIVLIRHLQVLAKRFKAMSTPDIVLRVRVTKGFEKIIERVFV